VFSSCNNEEKTQELKLWYNKPAKQWVEALPIENGRLGAMVFGDPVNEVIQLNEDTLWAGGPNRNDMPTMQFCTATAKPMQRRCLKQ
jgi:alpha-L-fucosidase 2